MTTRIDGPGIAGEARAKYPAGQGFWKVTPSTPTPPKPTPETGEATDVQLRECYHTAKGTWTDYLRAVYDPRTGEPRE